MNQVTKSGNRRGIALLLVLGVLSALAWLCAAIVTESRHQMAEQTAFTRRGAMRISAWSAVEAAVAVLRERREAAGGLYKVPSDMTPVLFSGGYKPPQGWDVVVTAEDLSGRYGLRALGRERLRDLLNDLDIPFEDATSLAEGMIRIMNPDPTRNERGFRDDLPGAPDHPGQDFVDLRLVPGFAKAFLNEDGTPNSRLENFIGCVSILGDTIKPNLNSASEPMLQHLMKRGAIADANALARWLSGRDGIRGTEDDRHAMTVEDFDVSGGGVMDRTVVTTVTRVKIHAQVRFGEGVFSLTVVADPTSQSRGFPWKILNQLENEDPR